MYTANQILNDPMFREMTESTLYDILYTSNENNPNYCLSTNEWETIRVFIQTLYKRTFCTELLQQYYKDNPIDLNLTKKERFW